MKLFAIIFGFALLLHLTIMMSLMVKWGVGAGDRDKLSKAWHGYSVVFRVSTLVLWAVMLWPDYTTILLLLPLYLVFAWVIWDGTIAVGLGQSWWYVGKTSTWDKWWNEKTSKIVKIIIIIVAVLSIAGLIELKFIL